MGIGNKNSVKQKNGSFFVNNQLKKTLNYTKKLGLINFKITPEAPKRANP